MIIGIDPGNAGALAFFDKGVAVSVLDMPVLKMEGKGKTKKGNIKVHTVIDEQLLREHLYERINIEHVFIEKSQSMPGQGAPATFNYACGYGIIRGICVGLQIPYTLVHPATWRKALMKDMDKGKGSSIIRAKQLFPNMDIGKKDGRAEALLIGWYGIKFIFGD